MNSVPVNYSILLAVILFVIGLTGVMIRRDLVFVLMSIEIMLSSANIVFIAAAAKHGSADGNVAVVFVIITAAAEVAVGLALLLRVYRKYGTVDLDELSGMKG